MYGDALDAIRGLLSNFSAVTKIYVSTMPKSFVRPSFYINLATSDEEHLNRAMYQTDMTWQIVYFAPLFSTGQVDVFNQLSVSSALKKVLMDAMTVTGPSGTKYHVINTEGGPRDAEVYITVRLQTEMTRPKEQFDPMREVHHKQKEG
jgi:hypothetical protein